MFNSFINDIENKINWDLYKNNSQDSNSSENSDNDSNTLIFDANKFKLDSKLNTKQSINTPIQLVPNKTADKEIPSKEPIFGKTDKIENKTQDSPDTIPLVPSKNTVTPETKVTTIPIAPQKTPNSTGLVVERTTVDPTKKNPDTDIDKNINKDKAQKPQKQIPQKFEQHMDKVFGGKYSTASEEEKIKLIGQYIRGLKNNKADTTTKPVDENLKDLLSSADKPEDQVRVIHSIRHLDRKDQLDSARLAMNQNNRERKDLAQKTVAGDLPYYDKSVQVPLTKEIVNTKNVDAIKICADQISKLDATRADNTSNQVEAAKILANTGLEKADQLQIDKKIIDQYAKFDIASQLDIHKIMSASKETKTVEYAASNIWHLDRSNQSKALHETIITGNEKAINAAASQYQRYDDSVKSDIASQINATNYGYAKEILADAQKSDGVASSGSSNYYCDKDTTDTDNNYTYGYETDEKEFIKTTSEYKLNEIQEMIDANQNSIALEIKIKNLSDIEKIALLQRCSSPDIIRIILGNNPSLEVLSKIDPEYLKSVGYKNFGSQICFLSASAQKFIVESSALDGSLSGIDRNLLKTPIKEIYDQKLKELQNKNNNRTNFIA